MNKHDEYNDFLNKCKNIDFSTQSKNKEKNLKILCNEIQENSNEKGETTMNKKFSKKLLIAASLAAILVITSGTVYATGLNKVIKSFMLGEYSEHIQEEKIESVPVPEELKGQLFDKEGNPLSILTRDIDIYNSNGEKSTISEDDGKLSVITEEEENSKHKINYVTFDNLEEAKTYFISDIATPTYSPSGYSFKNAQFMGDSKDNIKEDGGNKYMDIYYSNGEKSFTCNLRYMDEETSYSMITDDELKEVILNGYKAIIGEKDLTILIGEVEYTFYSEDSVTIDELIKVAESLK